MQSEDGIAGMWADSPVVVHNGDRITVIGTLATLYGERVLQNITLVSTHPGTPPVATYVAPKDFGGVGLTSVDPTLGSSKTPKETGLLVYTEGVVTRLDNKGKFQISGTGNVVGICAPGTPAPIPGTSVIATGISAGYGVSPYPILLMSRDEFIYTDIPFGVNLIKNPGGEEGASGTNGVLVDSIPGWSVTPGFTVTNYGYIYPTTESQRISGGRSFFFGGLNCASSQATQDIGVGCLAGKIDSGTIMATLSGYLGGRDTEGDRATVTATFFNAAGTSIGTLTIGPQAACNNTWVYHKNSIAVPFGTRNIQIKMIGQRYNGQNMDSFFDNLSLVLTQR
jgi:hypothetical protein